MLDKEKHLETWAALGTLGENEGNQMKRDIQLICLQSSVCLCGVRLYCLFAFVCLPSFVSHHLYPIYFICLGSHLSPII